MSFFINQKQKTFEIDASKLLNQEQLEFFKKTNNNNPGKWLDKNNFCFSNDTKSIEMFIFFNELKTYKHSFNSMILQRLDEFYIYRKLFEICDNDKNNNKIIIFKYQNLKDINEFDVEMIKEITTLFESFKTTEESYFNNLQKRLLTIEIPIEKYGSFLYSLYNLIVRLTN
jgi:hypothetical protein